PHLGRFWGDREDLLRWQGIADAAYEALLESPREDVYGWIDKPTAPRCRSNAWLQVLYLLAGGGGSPLRGRERDFGWRPTTFAVLERDLATSSVAAIDLIAGVPGTQASIISLGERAYRIGSNRPVVVTGREDQILQAFLARSPMDLEQL